MSIPDKEPPTYQISSPKDREQIVAEVVAHAALQEAQYKQPLSDPAPPGRWKGPLALAVLFVAGLLAAFPPGWAGSRPSRLTDEDRLRGLRAAIHIQAQQLDAFRAREGRLPGSLEELELAVPGMRYVRSNNRVYQLVATGPDGRNLVYDSAQPAAEFAAVASEWIVETSGS